MRISLLTGVAVAATLFLSSDQDVGVTAYDVLAVPNKRMLAASSGGQGWFKRMMNKALGRKDTTMQKRPSARGPPPVRTLNAAQEGNWFTRMFSGLRNMMSGKNKNNIKSGSLANRMPRSPRSLQRQNNPQEAEAKGFLSNVFGSWGRRKLRADKRSNTI